MIIFLWLIVAGFAFFQYSRETMFKAKLVNCELQSINHQIINDLNQGYEIESVASDFEPLRVSLINLNGRVIYDNHIDTLTTNHLTRPEIVQAMRDGQGYSIARRSDSDAINYFYSATTTKGYIVRTAREYTPALRDLLSADMVFLSFMFTVSIIITIIAFFVANKLAHNITRLNNFARKAERGDKIDIDQKFPNGELGDISRHIIQLYASLQETTAQRDSEHHKVIHEQKEKARIKKLLTNNINHELKTPVTALLGYLETLVENPNINTERKDQFINNCYKHACRLQNLLADVSTITLMDERSDMIKKEDVRIAEIISEIATEMEYRCEDKKLRIHSDLPEDMIVRGDHALISAIFMNLTNNASNYSGGRDIFISLVNETPSDYTIIFADNGVGVDPVHFDKLFERFYRVDKGRSRKDGGTGLGLSIVKNAVLIHGGEICVRARKMGGLEFEFTLKKL